MGLKCSVLGHAYGETTVERDREERGSEVVITIRELETCDRCGDTRIVTENKEVTTIETSDEPEVTPEDAMAALEGSETTESEPVVEDAEGGTATGGPTPDAVEDQGAEILDEDAEEEPVDDELADPTVEEDSETPADAGEEDAVFIDDDGDEDSETEAQEAGTEDAGEPAEEADAERGPFEPPEDEADDSLGEWPEETLRDDEEEDWTPSEELSGTVGDVEASDVDRTLSTNSAVTVPEGEFYCEECGYTTSVEASSLRAGDYCPECHEGALAHRAEE